jgi:sec-independent protein translocase protein TatB
VFNLSGSEIVVILLLALVVLGPDKLPDAMRKAGRTFAELKKMASGFQDEIRKGFDEPSAELRKTAETIREAATVPGVTTRAKPSAKMAAATAASEAATEPASYPDKPQHNPEVDAIPDLPPGNSVAPAATAAAAVGLAGAAIDGDTPDAADDTTDAAGARHGADDMATDAAEPMPDAPVADRSADASDDLVDTDDEAAAVGPDLGA